MNDEQQGSQQPLTREAYRKHAEQPEPSSEPKREQSSRRQQQADKPSLWTRLRGRFTKQDAQDVPPEVEPTASRIQEKGNLTPEQKTARLAHRLNVAIIVLVVLIILVYIILRFVG